MANLIRISLNNVQFRNSAKTLLSKINAQSVRTITSKLDDLPPKPKPWDYNEKSFTLLQYFYDKTTSRFDENTKVSKYIYFDETCGKVGHIRYLCISLVYQSRKRNSGHIEGILFVLLK